MTKPASRRQREWRRRQACGVVMLNVPVVQHAIADAMIEAGLLSVGEALDTAELSRTASDILGEWTRRWAEKA